MQYVSAEGKLTLRQVKAQHKLSTVYLAALAGVEPSIIYAMECGAVLSRCSLDKILGALSRVTGKEYSRETVGGYWIKKEE